MCVDDKMGFLLNERSYYDMILKDIPDSYDLTFTDDKGEWNKVRDWPLMENIKIGKNAIVIYGLDTDNSKNGLIGTIKIKTLDKAIDDKTLLSITKEEDKGDKEAQRIIRIFKKMKIE